jgi:transposase-like protein
VGRPSLLTDDLTQQIAALVEHGHYIETVCQSLGITKQTYYNWLEQAETDRTTNVTAETPHTRFFDAVKTAEARAEMTLSVKWLEADAKEWLKYATFQSRRFRKRWHDKEPEQHNTFVQNNYGAMPGQAAYTVPELPPAIAADVLSPPVSVVEGETVRNP